MYSSQFAECATLRNHKRCEVRKMVVPAVVNDHQRGKIEKMLKRYIVSKLQEQHTRSSAIKKRRLFDRHAIIAIQLFNATVKMHFDFWNINYVAYRIEGPRIISNGSVAFELASTRSRTIQFHDLNEHHFLKRK